MKSLSTILIVSFLVFVFSCDNPSHQDLIAFSPDQTHFNINGRFDLLKDNAIGLIGSASSIEFNVSGDSVILELQSQYPHGNNFAVVINGEYQQRFMIKDSLIKTYTIHLPPMGVNKVGIFKTSEAATGNLIFHGIRAISLSQPPAKRNKTIEFIGNSITCGAQSDPSEEPCGEGYYHDQHNAYLAYGPRLARALKTDFFLSAVSGIGMYRNWNDENVLEPIMPQVYENLYLDLNSNKPYSFEIKPDIVSICLGTNDMSTGDGIKERKNFSRDKFIKNYISFVDKVYNHYPDCEVILLNAPVIFHKNKKELFSCLWEVKEHFKGRKDILLFDFDGIKANGCTGHPSIQDQAQMTQQLLPVFEDLISN